MRSDQWNQDGLQDQHDHCCPSGVGRLRPDLRFQIRWHVARQHVGRGSVGGNQRKANEDLGPVVLQDVRQVVPDENGVNVLIPGLVLGNLETR